MTLAPNLAAVRLSAGITQADLADRMEVSRSLIAQWECQLTGVSARMMPRLCAALKTTAEAITAPAAMENVKKMTFAIRNLSVLAYAQGFTLWHYRVRDAVLAVAQAEGFFSPAADMLAAGDMILISATDGGQVAFVTDAAEARGVTVAPLSA